MELCMATLPHGRRQAQEPRLEGAPVVATALLPDFTNRDISVEQHGV
jgi:hypothetical protein